MINLDFDSSQKMTMKTRQACYWTILLVITATLCKVDGKMVDLSHSVDKDTFMALPDFPKYQTEVGYDGEIAPGVYATAYTYTVSEHGGTHIDAPKHFSKKGLSVEKIPLEKTIADGVMIDCTNETAQDPNYQLTLQKLKDWEKVHGRIPANCAVVINYNWSHRYANATLYLNPLDPTDTSDAAAYRFPTVSVEAIDFLVDERDINILALDTMSPDLINTTYPAHVKLAENNKLLVENIRNPGQLPAKGFRFYASPAKFVGSTGVQTRVWASIQEECGNGGGRQCPSRPLVVAATVIVTLMSIFFSKLSVI